MQFDRRRQAAQTLCPDALLPRVQMFNNRRHARGFVAFVGEMHAAECRSRFAPAATGAETAQPSDEMANGDARRERICRPPPRHLVQPHDNYRGDDRAQKAAVKNAV